MMVSTGYGDTLVTTAGLFTAVLLTGYQVLLKPMFQVKDTKWYLINGRETVGKLGYIHFPKITPAKLIQQPKIHAHLKALRTKTSRQKVANEKD